METLREGIKARYRHYHLINRDRFPDITYNTNRANYKPLHDSFNEEFFVVRGLKNSAAVHIPSPNTLALLFTDDEYVPSKKILETCQAYSATDVVTPVIRHRPGSNQPEEIPTKKRLRPWVVSVLLLLAVLGLFSEGYYLFRPKPTRLVITRPTPRSLVPQELVIEGTVSNAETVWLVVHPKRSPYYYIQLPIKVQRDGVWLGVVYIGSLNQGDIGLPFEVRAFVNPVKQILDEEIYTSWPDAECSSAVLEVTRQ